MSALTEHVEQLAKDISAIGAMPVVSKSDPSMTSFVPHHKCESAARLMTAMAKYIEIVRQRSALLDDIRAAGEAIDHPVDPHVVSVMYNQRRHLASILPEARRELDALIPKENDHAR